MPRSAIRWRRPRSPMPPMSARGAFRPKNICSAPRPDGSPEGIIMAALAQRSALPETPVLRTVAELRAQIGEWRGQGETIGLVPTMGALHEGHLTLVRQAKAECSRAVATLFVNPTQFAPAEDFDAYPRDEAKDRALLAEAGCDLLYAPGVLEIYPQGFSTTVTVAHVSEGME